MIYFRTFLEGVTKWALGKEVVDQEEDGAVKPHDCASQTAQNVTQSCKAISALSCGSGALQESHTYLKAEAECAAIRTRALRR